MTADDVAPRYRDGIDSQKATDDLAAWLDDYLHVDDDEQDEKYHAHTTCASRARVSANTVALYRCSNCGNPSASLRKCGGCGKTRCE
jgi:hypothetical protein